MCSKVPAGSPARLKGCLFILCTVWPRPRPCVCVCVCVRPCMCPSANQCSILPNNALKVESRGPPYKSGAFNNNDDDDISIHKQGCTGVRVCVFGACMCAAHVCMLNALYRRRLWCPGKPENAALLFLLSFFSSSSFSTVIFSSSLAQNWRFHCGMSSVRRVLCPSALDLERNYTWTGHHTWMGCDLRGYETSQVKLKEFYVALLEVMCGRCGSMETCDIFLS